MVKVTALIVVVYGPHHITASTCYLVSREGTGRERSEERVDGRMELSLAVWLTYKTLLTPFELCCHPLVTFPSKLMSALHRLISVL